MPLSYQMKWNSSMKKYSFIGGGKEEMMSNQSGGLARAFQLRIWSEWKGVIVKLNFQFGKKSKQVRKRKKRSNCETQFSVWKKIQTSEKKKEKEKSEKLSILSCLDRKNPKERERERKIRNRETLKSQLFGKIFQQREKKGEKRNRGTLKSQLFGKGEGEIYFWSRLPKYQLKILNTIFFQTTFQTIFALYHIKSSWPK